MQENKNLVEEALIQMKNVEEAIAENAKGILASTMKEEINQLVKESLSEQDEIDVDAEVDDLDTDDEEVVDVDVDMDADDDETDMDMDLSDMDSEVNSDDMDDDSLDMDVDKPIDLTDVEDDEFLLKVFKAMGEDDGIIVKKDNEDVHLVDNDADTEYLIKLGESIEEETMEYNEESETDKRTQEIINAIFDTNSDEMGMDSDMNLEEEDEIVYEIEFTEESDMDIDEEMSEEVDEEMSEEVDEEMEEEVDEYGHDYMSESYSHKKSMKSETKESKMSVKPKGVGMGKAKFSYKKTSGGFNEDKKEGPKKMGTGKAKFEYKKGENMGGTNKVVKKTETKEAARTLGMGSNFRKGGLPKPRAHSKVNLNLESLESEVSSLREKNEEYRKALNVFREKLNEVAIFNSNLAYATRLFTEHSTTKKEKINILRRFDGVESLKESKGLYKTMKEELSKTETKSITESVGTKLNKTVQTGSATTLIESKTYEAPQFLRIKDLMSKIG
jgi:hypothetical protein